MNVNALLPHALDVGEVRRWFLPLPPHDAVRVVGASAPKPEPEPEPEHLIIVARFLGVGTSFTETHSDHRDRFVERGVRCNACRWFEVRIFRELLLDEDLVDLDRPGELEREARDAPLGSYVIHTSGMSVVTGEVPFYRYESVTSPHSVVEALTTRRISDHGPEAFITKPSARALAETAGHDRDMRRAYVDRAVS